MKGDKKQNFIKLDRGILESMIWEKPSDWYKIWCYILMKAKFQDDERHNIPKGGWLTKYSYIESGCNVSYKTVENFMRWAKVEGMVVVQKRNRFVLIEVKNWGKFQSSSGTESANAGNSQEIGSGTIIEEGKKEERKNNIKQELEKFIDYWNDYFGEKRQVTIDLQNAYKSLRKKYSMEQFQEGANKFFEAKKDCDKQYMLSPISFIKQSNGFISYI